MENFIERAFQEVPGGEFDNNGFYHIPDGSFWDPDGVYFNKEGLDKHGGFYNENLEYIPGKGWIDDLMCYEDEKQDILKKQGRGVRPGRPNDAIDDEDDDLEDPLGDLYENIDYDRILNDEEKKYSQTHHDQMKHDEKHTIQVTNIKPNNKTGFVKPEAIDPDLLFNKIPENKMPQKQEKKEVVKTEKCYNADSLFD